MTALAYTFGVFGLCLILMVFSYLDLVYRQLGRVTPERIRQHVDSFEAEIEPRLHRERRHAGLGFAILANIALAAVAVETALGVLRLVPRLFDATVVIAVYLVVEIAFFAQLIPTILLGRTKAHWVRFLTPW